MARTRKPTPAFDVLSDPIRRCILESLAEGERTSGELVEILAHEFTVSQSGVSQHLKVLRENGFATVRHEGTRRVYALDTSALRDVDAWLARFRRFWERRVGVAAAPSLPKGRSIDGLLSNRQTCAWPPSTKTSLPVM